MPDTTRPAWTRVSPWLDELLELDGSARESRLGDIAVQDPVLARQLGQLLHQLAGLDQHGFMRGMARAAPDSAGRGQVVGAYTLELLLGEGGMGSVWLAHRSDGRFEGQVAIKFVHGSQRSPALARRFTREAEVLARLSHPHIARLLDAGVVPDGALPYLVLEYVDGLPIHTWCEQQHIGLRGRLGLLLDVMDAVAHAHDRLVLHRDLKPTNILVDRQGTVKLLDFGIARLLGDAADGDPDLTRVGGTPYTPMWASPEQVRGDEVTPASDVFALGLLMHRLLTGHHPLGPEQPARSAETLRRLLDEPLPRASAHMRAQGQPADAARALRGDLDTIIERALKRAPAERYRSVAEMADDVRRHLRHEPILARPDSPAYRAGRFLRRHWFSVGAAGSVAAALLVGGGVALLQARQAQAERAQVESLLDYMLGDLSSKLEPLGQLPLLDGVATRAAAYHATRGVAELDDDGLARRSEALHLLAGIAQQRGQVDDMARLAGQAQDGSTRLLQRRPGGPQALQLSAESAALVAWAAELQGQVGRAQASYLQAVQWATEALALQPGDRKARLVLATIQGEYAALLADMGGEAAAQALPLFDAEHDTLLQLVAGDPALWNQVSNNRTWVADILYLNHRYEDSLVALRQHRQAQSRLPALADKPGLQWNDVLALNRESGVLLALGRAAEAEAASSQAVALGSALIAGDPSNADWAMQGAMHLEQHATALLALGRADDARRRVDAAVRRMQALPPIADSGLQRLASTWLRVLARQAELQPQDRDVAEALRQRVAAELARPDGLRTRNRELATDLARGALALGAVWVAQGRAGDADAVHRAAFEALQATSTPTRPMPAGARAVRVRLLLALGRRDEARGEVQALRALGWRRALPAV